MIYIQDFFLVQKSNPRKLHLALLGIAIQQQHPNKQVQFFPTYRLVSGCEICGYSELDVYFLFRLFREFQTLSDSCLFLCICRVQHRLEQLPNPNFQIGLAH